MKLSKELFKPSSDEFIVKVVDKPTEIKALLEIGFEFIFKKDGLAFLRKRK